MKERKLRDELLDAQSQLRKDRTFALALIVAGVPTAGRSETVNELLEWLDPKHISVRAFGAPDREDRQRPPLWRYWRSLPARGRITIYFAGWYGDYMSHALRKSGTERDREKRAAERIRRLEIMLAADKVRVLKVYLTTDTRTQRARLAKLRADKLTRWRVTRKDEWFARRYRTVARAANRCLKATDHEAAPWHVIDGTDEQQRLLSVGSLLRDELLGGLKQDRTRPAPSWPQESSAKPLEALPARASKVVTDEEYDFGLEALQGRLALLVQRARFRKHALVLAFEGMDAAGKGGAIRRITHALDARQYQVAPVSAPTPEESLYPWLWRFWRCIPELGAITIYDRSWYGRVLVERVRDLTPEPDWRRAYDEIREFELQLSEHGIIVAKFWLNVSEDEQLQRFKARDENPLKRFKVDQEDWANRRYYDAYQSAAADMIRRTHADHARWTVIAGDHKKTARLVVLRTVCEEIERTLDRPTG